MSFWEKLQEPIWKFSFGRIWLGLCIRNCSKGVNRECEGLFVNFMGLYDIIGCHMLYFVVNYINIEYFGLSQLILFLLTILLFLMIINGLPNFWNNYSYLCLFAYSKMECVVKPNDHLSVSDIYKSINVCHLLSSDTILCPETFIWVVIVGLCYNGWFYILS